MKKTVKIAILVSIMAAMVVLLTGCGGDKLVATKTEDGLEQKVEVTFKNDKASEIVMTMETNSEEEAEEAADMYKGIMAMASGMAEEGGEEVDLGMEVEAKGKKLIIKMNAEAFMEQYGEDVSDEELTREALEKSLEESGFTIK